MSGHVIAGLAKRRAELAGEADALKARLARIAGDMAQLDAVIRLFDPAYDTGGIRPKRPRAADGAGRGEMARFVLGVLREAGEPVAVAAFTKRLMAERQMDPADLARARTVAKRVAMALRVQEQGGTVRALREPRHPVRWTIAG